MLVLVLVAVAVLVAVDEMTVGDDVVDDVVVLVQRLYKSLVPRARKNQTRHHYQHLNNLLRNVRMYPSYALDRKISLPVLSQRLTSPRVHSLLIKDVSQSN